MAAFDPTKISSNLTASNGNRTVVANTTNNWQCAIGDFLISSGKVYFEMEIAGTDAQLATLHVGICDQGGGTDFDKDVRIGWNESWGLIRDTTDGWVYYHDAAYQDYIDHGGSSDGSILMFAIDQPNGRFWFGVDGVWLLSGNPATGANPLFEDSSIAATDIAACAGPVISGAGSVTSLFDAAQMTYSPPSGFSAPAASTEESISEGLGFGEAMVGELEVWGEKDFTVTIGIGDFIDRQANQNAIPPADTLAFGETISKSIEFGRESESEFGLSGETDGFNYSAWLRANPSRAVYRFEAKLTGANDGVADYVFQGLKSVQTRIRTGEPSYLGVVLAFSAATLAAIVARPNGVIVIDMIAMINGVESLRETISQAAMTGHRYDLGPLSKSISLTGYSTFNYGGANIEVDHVVRESMYTDGRISWRCPRADFYLRPGDHATYNGQTIVVGSVAILCSPESGWMDITEA
jgi:hypothetical protein